MVGYSKSRIAEFMKEKGFGIQAPIDNGYDYVRIEMDEFDDATFNKLKRIVKGNELHEVDK